MEQALPAEATADALADPVLLDNGEAADGAPTDKAQPASLPSPKSAAAAAAAAPLPPEEPPACQLQLNILEDGSVVASIRLPDSSGPAAEESAAPGLPPAATEAAAAETEGQPLAQAQQEQLHALQEERQRLLEENQLLQRLARQYINSGSKATKQSMEDASASMAGVEQRYAIGLQQLQKLLAQRAAAEERMQQALAPEKERLVAAQAKFEAGWQAFLGFVSQAAEAAKRSGPASSKAAAELGKAVQAFLAAEPAKAGEVTSLRLRNAALQHRVTAAERKLKDSNRLSEGLHLIDFEQLKIENSTLSYRIEARSGEVLKLRGKLTQAIQMAAHAREKLHCMEQERRQLEAKLEAAEAQLQAGRQDLTAAKARREALLAARADLQRDWSVVTDRCCLADMKAQEARLAELQAEAGRLQAQCEALRGSKQPK